MDGQSPSRGTGRAKRRLSDQDDPSRKHLKTSDTTDSAKGDKATGGRSTRIQGIVHTRPHNRDKKGDNGVPLDLTANYFCLRRAQDWSLYKYHVTFDPEIMVDRVRKALIYSHKDIFGGYLFDGTQLFLNRRLRDDQELLSARNRENVEHHIRLRYTKEIRMDDNESIQVLNLIMRRAMQGLDLKMIQRNYFDPLAAQPLPQFNMQLWPGYDTSIRQHEHDILMNVDVRTKVMRTDTVYDLLVATRGNRNEFQQKVLGITVLTDYNNQTYRIDDVDFDSNPSTTFPHRGQDISFLQYYQQKYNKTIRDRNQPLLISKATSRSIRGGGAEIIRLIPELCRMTGLTDQQRVDINFKNAMRPFTSARPPQRIQRLLDFNRRVRITQASMETFNAWQLALDPELVRIRGRQIEPQHIRIGENQEFVEPRANWDRQCGRPLFQARPMTRWYVIYPKRLEQETRNLVMRLIALGVNMRFTVDQPRRESFNNDNEMLRCLDVAARNNPQMIMCIIDNNRVDSYSQIKKKLCHDYAVPSQVVTRKTVTRRNNFDSVVTKIGIQMCTKLGGAPWLPRIPGDGIMTIGYDVSVDSVNKRQSFGALVATMDLRQGVNFFSAVSVQTDSDTLSTDFSMNVIKAVRAYKEMHERLPAKIIIYRGGIGDGQLTQVRDVEVDIVERRLKDIYAQFGQQLEMIFIVVNKRINTRIFHNRENPPPGTIVDDVITLPERYDFYLVPQQITQGTATPTLYNVIYDTSGLSAGRIQTWTYRMCHMYYNWSGTTRVPAVVQYATKLSFLVANAIHRLPNTELEKRLYFL